MPPAGFRALALFWAGLLAVAAAGALVLQLLGPPARPVAGGSPADIKSADIKSADIKSADIKSESTTQPATVEPAAMAAVPSRPGRDTPGPIPAPQPALLEPSRDNPGGFLPRIAGGRMPSQVYARGFDRSDLRPRVGLLLAGVGLNGADSEDAIRSLPAEVTLAFSPYASRGDRLVEAARTAGHEFLISLPMEPQGYPLNDAGDHAMLTSSPPEQNRSRLDWALTRIQGYAGATGALGMLRGERFGGAAGQMAPVLHDLADRGLYYVDPRPGQAAPPFVWGRAVDLVIDEPAVRTEIEAKLARLEQIARDKGSALGLVGAVRPVTVDRLAAWSNGLAARGLVLAPVSAIVLAPETKAAGR